MKTKIKYWSIGILLIIGLFLLFGIVTDLIPNPWFDRIAEKTRPENITVEVIAKNLVVPWSIDFLPDGRIIFTERGGRINIIEEENGKVITVAEIDVAAVGEGGLLGIAVDPDFDDNNFVYVYYTYKDNGLWNKVVRFRMTDSDLLEYTIILDKIPGAINHNGGRIKFGPDGKLYITTGDALEPKMAQDVNSLAGKILRINKDGSIPADNPFRNAVYSYGHRNPQGLAWHPVTDELYSTEHGAVRNDEINIIKPGKNYGWPIVECESKDYQSPIKCYKDFTLAPSGASFYDNDLYIAGLRGKQLRKIILDKDYKTVLEEKEIITDLGRIRDSVERDGYLYITTSNRDGRGIPKLGDDKIIKINSKFI